MIAISPASALKRPLSRHGIVAVVVVCSAAGLWLIAIVEWFAGAEQSASALQLGSATWLAALMLFSPYLRKAFFRDGGRDAQAPSAA